MDNSDLVRAIKVRARALGQIKDLDKRRDVLLKKCDLSPAIKEHMARIGCAVDRVDFSGYNHRLEFAKGDAVLSINVIAFYYDSKNRTPAQIVEFLQETCDIAKGEFVGKTWKGYRGASLQPGFKRTS